MYARFQGPNEWLKWALVIKIIDHNAINIYRRKFKIRKVCMWRKCRYDFRIEISLLHWCWGKCTWFEVVPKLNALEHGSDFGVHVLKDLAVASQGLIPAEQEQGWSFLASFLNSCNQLVLLGSMINLKMSSFCRHRSQHHVELQSRHYSSFNRDE